jgi:hypothetical protein
VFLHPVRYKGHISRSGSSGAENVDALFFMLGWARCGPHKKCTGTHYVELVFLHLGGPVGRVVHCGASMAQNVDELFFMLRLARCWL